MSLIKSQEDRLIRARRAVRKLRLEGQSGSTEIVPKLTSTFKAASSGSTNETPSLESKSLTGSSLVFPSVISFLKRI